MFAQQLSPFLLQLVELERLNPKLVARELQALVESLRSRRKVCYRCATETIGKRRPKRGQRAFCEEKCKCAQTQEDHAIRAAPAR